MNNCLNCGTKYESCATCEAQKSYYSYRLDFCSIGCFKNYQLIGGNIMRIHTLDSKTYTVKKYDFKTGKFTTTNDLTFKKEEIGTWIFTREDYDSLEKFVLPKSTKKVEEKEEVEE